MTLSVVELAKKYELKDIGPCNCSGYHTERYSDGKYTLRWRTRKYMFKVQKRNDSLNQWTPVNKLQAFLENLFKDGKPI